MREMIRNSKKEKLSTEDEETLLFAETEQKWLRDIRTDFEGCSLKEFEPYLVDRIREYYRREAKYPDRYSEVAVMRSLDMIDYSKLALHVYFGVY